MDISQLQSATNISGIDSPVSCSRLAELFRNQKEQSLETDKCGQTDEIASSGKTFEQLLEKLETYHECVSVANAQLKQKMKASTGIEGQLISIERRDEIEIYRSSMILAYNNMIGAVFNSMHKQKTKQTENLSLSIQYHKIIDNAAQCSIEVTNQLLDFLLLL